MRDDELVGQILAGNTAQFEALVDRYLPMVRGLCRSRVANSSSHDDLVQEVFLQGYLQLDRLRDASRFGPWLARIARNHCYTWLRSQGRRMQFDTRAASEAPRTAPAPDAVAMGEESIEWVHKSIQRLPEKLRDAMTLFYVEGLSVSEAARCLEIREGALKKRLQYGRQAVGEDLFAQFEPKATPASETREQKARVMAALPLAAAPWKAGAAAGAASAGLAAFAKIIAVAVPLTALAAAVILTGTGWHPSWSASTVGNIAATTNKQAPASHTETTPDVPASEDKTVPARTNTGDVALTVTCRLPAVDNQPVKGPPAANTHLWLVPVRFNRPLVDRILLEAGADPATRDALLDVMASRIGEGGRGPAAADTAVDRKKLQVWGEKMAEAMKKKGLNQSSFVVPAWAQAREIITDAQGHCEITGLPAGLNLVSLSKPDPEKLRDVSGLDGIMVQANTRAERAIQIHDPVSAIKGTVVDAKTGAPVKDVEVAMSGDLVGPGTVTTCRSNADGRFEFGYMYGYGPFTLRATSNMYAPVTVNGERRSATPTEVEVRLNAPHAQVTGRVTSADGTPAHGVTIMRENVAGEGAQGGATTDAEGRYSLPHDGGRLTLYASATNVTSEKATIELQEGEAATQDFVLRPWGGVAIDLRAPAGKSVPDEIGSTILFHDSGCTVGRGLERRDGLFWLDYLEPGDYSLVFALKNFEGVRLDFQVPSPPKAQRFTVALREPEGGVRVRVLDEKGRPKADAGLNVHVTRTRYDESGHERGSASASLNYDKPEGERTDASGECLLQGLPQGEYKVMSRNAEAEFSVPTDEVVVLRMTPEADLAEPAIVYLDKKSIRPIDEAGKELPFGTDPLELFVVTDSGTVSTSHVQAGHNTVYAILRGHTAGVARVDLSKETFEEWRQSSFGANPVKAVFAVGGAITGTLTDAVGQPIGDKKLAVLPAEWFDVASGNWEAERGGWEDLMVSLAQGAKTQADGSFRIDFLPEGSYYVGWATHSNVFPFEGNPVEVRTGADAGPIALVMTPDEKAQCP